MPSDWPSRIHPVIHVSLLEHAAGDTFPRQHPPPPTPVEVDSEEEYQVDEALGSRLPARWRKLQHLVKWAIHTLLDNYVPLW